MLALIERAWTRSSREDLSIDTWPPMRVAAGLLVVANGERVAVIVSDEHVG